MTIPAEITLGFASSRRPNYPKESTHNHLKYFKVLVALLLDKNVQRCYTKHHGFLMKNSPDSGPSKYPRVLTTTQSTSKYFKVLLLAKNVQSSYTKYDGFLYTTAPPMFIEHGRGAASPASRFLLNLIARVGMDLLCPTVRTSSDTSPPPK